MVFKERATGGGQSQGMQELPAEARKFEVVRGEGNKGFKVSDSPYTFLQEVFEEIGYDESARIAAGKRYKFPLSSCVGMVIFSEDEITCASHLMVGTKKRKAINETLKPIKDLLNAGKHILLVRGPRLRELQEEYLKDLNAFLTGCGVPQENIHVHRSKHDDIIGRERTGLALTIPDKRHVIVDYVDYNLKIPPFRETITRTP